MNESLPRACIIKPPGIGMSTFADSLGHVAPMFGQPAPKTQAGNDALQ